MTRTKQAILAVVAVGLAGALTVVVAHRSRPPQQPPLSPTEQRSAAIQETIQCIHEQCQRGGDGDWDRWENQSVAYRADLKSRISAAKPLNPTAVQGLEARSAVLEGRDQFPLFEGVPYFSLLHVIEPNSLDYFHKDRPVVAVARWLRRRGIDLIFVPVPKMTEVYPEYFANDCPQDRIVAPHVRRLILELLEADVEVIDLLPLFVAERDKDPEPLYQPADTHWGPRAQTLAARAIADHLKRYDFVAQAQAGPAIWTPAEVPYTPVESGAFYPALTPEQQQRARAHQPQRHRVPTPAAGAPPLPAHPPVTLVGDSYNNGLSDRICLELNLPVSVRAGGGQTTQAFKDFLRNPELLEGCRVVIWTNCNSTLEAGCPLPPAVKNCLDAPESK